MSAEFSDDHRICFIGDSFVQGTGDPECLGWVGRVAAKAQAAGWNVTPYNLGVRRDTSWDILARWEQESMRRFPPDTHHYVVFSFGVNDVTIELGAPRVSLTESRENFQRIIEVARSRYSTIVIGPPPMTDPEHNCRIQELSEAFGELAEHIGVPYLPVYNTLENDAIWKKDVATIDGAHPGVNGYSQLANLIQAWPSWWFHGN